MSQNLETLLEAARQLPPEARRRLIELLQEADENEPLAPDHARKQRALALVEETFGSIKGLDRATLTQLAEDEEFSGYLICSRPTLRVW